MLMKMFDGNVKRLSGYVEIEAFANERGGYCCGTCTFMRSTGGKSGTCALHLYELKSYGCCNQWKLGDPDRLLGYDGKRYRLRVIQGLA